MKTAIVIGSFDAFHNGHYDLIEYGLSIFDRLIIEISDNPTKKNWFSLEERCEMARLALSPFGERVTVHANENELKDLGKICIENGAYFILRGIKAGRTLDEEIRIQNVYKYILKEKYGIDINFVYKLTSDSDFRGSSLVKKYADDTELLSKMVPEVLVERISRRYRELTLCEK
jgi:pantetheine-phosphate adenylyltransferase